MSIDLEKLLVDADQLATTMRMAGRQTADEVLAQELAGAGDAISGAYRRLLAEMLRSQKDGARVSADLLGIHRVGSLVVDVAAQQVTVSGRVVPLSRMEFSLLALLVTAPTRVWKKDELLTQLWGENYTAGTRTLDSHACRLRQRLGGEFVRNVWGVGYRLIDGVAEEPAEPALRSVA